MNYSTLLNHTKEQQAFSWDCFRLVTVTCIILPHLWSIISSSLLLKALVIPLSWTWWRTVPIKLTIFKCILIAKDRLFIRIRVWFPGLEIRPPHILRLLSATHCGDRARLYLPLKRLKGDNSSHLYQQYTFIPSCRSNDCYTPCKIHFQMYLRWYMTFDVLIYHNTRQNQSTN